MHDEKMRDEFEAWAADNCHFWSLDTFEADGHKIYEDYDAATGWDVWRASRAALAVDIPPRPAVSMFASIGEARCAQEAHDRVVKAIEEAGVRVK